MTAAPGSDEVRYEVRAGVAWLTIDRPARRNALATTTITDLLAALSAAESDPAVHLVAFTATGDRAFCAGADLRELDELAQRGSPPPLPMRGVQRNLFEAVLDVPVPTVAVLNGPALAAGGELALSCDLRIAAEHATIGFPEAKRGLGANLATVMLPRLLPRAVALHMLYTGEPMPAGDALRWGLYNAVVTSAELADTAERLTATVTANAPLSLRRYKAMTTRGWDLPVPAALRLDAGPNPYLSADREEGVRAFLERRPPRWQGR